MGTSSIFLLLLVVIVLLVITIQGFRMRILLKMGLRNVSRRKVNTIIVVLGLMIGTSIISGSLVIGDTLENMYTKRVYDNYDETDEVIFTLDTEGNLGFFNFSKYEDLDAYISGNAENGSQGGSQDTSQDTSQDKPGQGFEDIIEDVSPEINYRVSVFNTDTKLSESDSIIIAYDYDQSKEFGGLHTTDGRTVTGEELGEREVYVNERLAEEIDAEAGNCLEILVGENESVMFTVKGVVEDEGRAAYVLSGSSGNNIMMSLETAQNLLGQEGKINIIKISNVGDERSGLEHSDAVEEALTPHLRTGQPVLLLNMVKQDNIESAEAGSSGMQDIFLMLGSFSIIAGMLLIVNIFVMLAEERKSEMGIARAVGLKQKQLMWMFLFEGTVYSVLSASVGTAGGLLVAFVVIFAFGSIGGNGRFFGETSGSMEFFTYSLDSLIIAFTAGMLITFVTIALTATRVSKLNIIRAIRNIPEPRYQRHEASRNEGTNSIILGLKTTVRDMILRQYEILIMILCALLVLLAFVNLGIFYNSKLVFSGSLSVFIYGFGLLLRRYLPDEQAFTIAGGLVLIFWCYPYDPVKQLFGITMDGDMELLIFAGLFMVSSALMVIMNNSNAVLGGMMKIFGRFKSLAPIFKTAISYPMYNRFRTGMTLAMFALIIFTVTMLSMMMALFGGNIEQITRENSGGYDMIAYTDPEFPIDNIEYRIEESENLSSDDFSEIVPLNTAYVLIYPVAEKEGAVDQRIQQQMELTPAEFQEQDETMWYNLLGCTDQFFQSSDFELQGWDEDLYDNYDDVWKAVKNDPSLVVMDERRMREPGENGEGHGPGGGGGPAFRVEAGDKVVIRDLTGNDVVVTVAGFTKSRLIEGVYIRSDAVSGDNGFQSDAQSIYLVKFKDSLSDSRIKDISKDLEQEFLANGMKTFIIKEELESMLQTMTSFMSLMQAFLSLGLIVGIAGLGIITIRSVSERKQQIGMLRAIGFKRGMILRSFLVESSYIALLGILTGTILGIILSLRFYLDDSMGPGFSGNFVIPWNTLIMVSLLSYGLTFISTVGPARRASMITPAEALRYIG